MPRSFAGHDEEDRLHLLLLLGIAIGLTYLHYVLVDYRYVDARWDAHQRMIDGTAESPYRFRVLIPMLADGAGRVASWVTGVEARKGVLAAYVAILFVTLSAGLGLFQIYLRRWLPRREALIGTLLVATAMPPTFLHYNMQPTSHPELIAFTLAIWLLDQRRLGWYWLLLAVSTLNRETSGFLIVLFVLCNLGILARWTLTKWTLVYGATWLSLYGGLRVLLGNADHVGSHRPDAWSYRIVANVTSWDSYVTVAVFFGALWWLAYRDQDRKPRILRRALWFVPVFFAAYLSMSHIHEVRYFLELCPIIVPLALLSLFNGGPKHDAGETAPEALRGRGPSS